MHVSLSSFAFSILLCAGHAWAQQSQHHIFTFGGDAAGDGFGFAVCGVGDIDKDGHDEVCAGAEAANNQTGYIRVFSGALGNALRTVHGAAAGDRYGYAVSDAGDVNNDGIPDLVVGAPGQSSTSGYVEVLSGLWLLANAGTKVLHTFNGSNAGDEYGFSVSEAGDVDKDGYDDVLIGARQKGAGTGFAEIRSGRTGTIIHTFLGGTGIRQFGRSVSHAGDPDKDGYPDAIVGAAYLWRVYSGKTGAVIKDTPNQGGKSVGGCGDVNQDGFDDVMVFQGPGPLPKKVVVYSGKDWSSLHTLNAGRDSVETTFMSRAGDVNGDGYPDVVVHNGGDPNYPVTIYSGKDAAVLMQVSGPASFGRSVNGAGDVDGDGVPDVIVGANGTSTTPGSAHVYSGRKRSLSTAIHSIDLTQGGTQVFSLDAGPAFAGSAYRIFGSITGTKPGVRLFGVDIPLNPDAYTDLAITNVSADPPFDKFQGVLSAQGTARASLIVPTGLPPISFSLFHAFVTHDALGRFLMASNPVPISIR